VMAPMRPEFSSTNLHAKQPHGLSRRNLHLFQDIFARGDGQPAV
jgi:hypothetical protein